jgi:hypothetical protein
VTAHYSDGTSETVTGYTLSGTIAEGSNTVTVSYGGKTTTFTVTGVAESGGEETTVVNLFDKNTMVQTKKYFVDGSPYQFINYESRDTALVPITKTDCYYAVHASNFPWAFSANQYIYLVSDVDGKPTWTRRIAPGVTAATQPTYVDSPDKDTVLSDTSLCRNDDNGKGYTFYVPSGTQYIAFGVRNGDTDRSASCMLEYGTACHDYVEYKG